MHVLWVVFCGWVFVFTNNDGIVSDVLLPSAFGGVPLVAGATWGWQQHQVASSSTTSQILKDRRGRKGPGELLTSSSPSLRVGGIKEDPTGSISFWGVCVWCGPALDRPCMSGCV